MEERWTICESGHVHWGANGGAALLLRHLDPEGPPTYLLQQRSRWVDEGGKWGIPGGAIRNGESPELTARRETQEEIGPVPLVLSRHRRRGPGLRRRLEVSHRRGRCRPTLRRILRAGDGRHRVVHQRADANAPASSGTPKLARSESGRVDRASLARRRTRTSEGSCWTSASEGRERRTLWAASAATTGGSRSTIPRPSPTRCRHACPRAQSTNK